MDLNQIAEKWQKRWAEAKIFEADADQKKKKFFSHFSLQSIIYVWHLFAFEGAIHNGANDLSDFSSHINMLIIY